MADQFRELYRPYMWFPDHGGFEVVEFRDLLSRFKIEDNKALGGYPVFKIMSIVNELRKVQSKRRSYNLAQLEEIKKQEEIKKLQLYNGEKNGTLIKRTYAKERVRLVFQNVVSKIRYAIKNTSPRLVGLDSARLIEEIITKAWNGAIRLLEEQAECIDWENDNLGENLSDTKPLTSYDAGEEKSSVVNNDTCEVFKNRSTLDSLNEGEEDGSDSRLDEVQLER